MLYWSPRLPGANGVFFMGLSQACGGLAERGIGRRVDVLV